MGPRSAESKLKMRDSERQCLGKSPVGCVIPDLLYIGPASKAASMVFLRTEGISRILSIGKSPPKVFEMEIDTPQGPRQLKYERLPLLDSENIDITPCVDKAISIIDNAAASGEKVLVHCSAAISRSPTVAAAYLMRCRGRTLQESLDTLIKARSVISPNPNFLHQLSNMEKEIFGEQRTMVVTLRGQKIELKDGNL